ncbi:MAG TPA: TfoX/Sxy family protein [Xanthomonadales bacterium]|nr:TfoX/Sxy family protein [Xanthomonadales bacterium]
MSDKLLNIGPKSAAWLRQVGVRTHDDLKALGAVGVFLKVKRAGFRPSLNLLYALAGAELGCHWTELKPEHKQAMVLEVNAYDDQQALLKKKIMPVREIRVAEPREEGADAMPAPNLFDEPDAGEASEGGGEPPAADREED